jgi:hypothetical protein
LKIKNRPINRKRHASNSTTKTKWTRFRVHFIIYFFLNILSKSYFDWNAINWFFSNWPNHFPIFLSLPLKSYTGDPLFPLFIILIYSPLYSLDSTSYTKDTSHPILESCSLHLSMCVVNPVVFYKLSVYNQERLLRQTSWILYIGREKNLNKAPALSFSFLFEWMNEWMNWWMNESLTYSLLSHPERDVENARGRRSILLSKKSIYGEGGREEKL